MTLMMPKKSTNDPQFIMPFHSLKKKLQKGSAAESPVVSPAGRQTSAKIRYNLKSNTKSKRRSKMQGLVMGLGAKQDQILLQLNRIYQEQKQVKKSNELIEWQVLKPLREQSRGKIQQLVSEQMELKSMTAGLREQLIIEKKTNNKISSLQEKCILLSKETQALKWQNSKLQDSSADYRQRLQTTHDKLANLKQLVKAKDKLLIQLQHSSKTKFVDLGSQLAIKTAEADTLRSALQDKNTWLTSLQNQLNLKKEMYCKLEQSFCKVLEVNTRLQDKLQGESNLLERMLLESQARKRNVQDVQSLRIQNCQLRRQVERLQCDYNVSVRQNNMLTDRVHLAEQQHMSQKKRLQLLLDQLNHYKASLQRQSQQLFTQRTLRSAHKDQLQKSCQKLQESLSAKNMQFLQLSMRKEEIERQINTRREEVQTFNSRVSYQKQQIQANQEHMTKLKERLDKFLLSVQEDRESTRPEELIRTVINLQNQLFNCQQQSECKSEKMLRQLKGLQEQVDRLNVQLTVLQQQNRIKTLRIQQLQSLLDQFQGRGDPYEEISLSIRSLIKPPHSNKLELQKDDPYEELSLSIQSLIKPPDSTNAELSQFQEKGDPYQEMSLSIRSLIKPPDSTKAELSQSLDFDLPIFSKIKLSCFSFVGESIKTGSVLRAAYLCLAPFLIFKRRSEVVQQIRRMCGQQILQQVHDLQLNNFTQLKQRVEKQPKIDLFLTQFARSLMRTNQLLLDFLERVSLEWGLTARRQEDGKVSVEDEVWVQESQDVFLIGAKSEYI